MNPAVLLGLRTFLGLMLVTLALVSPASARSQAESGSYTSPTFGYQISWDASWSVQEEGSEGGRDLLVLGNGVAVLVIDGSTIHGGDAGRCIRSYRSFLETSAEYGNVRALLDADGRPIAVSGARRAMAGFAYTWTLADGTFVEVAEYIACTTVVPAESTVTVSAIVELAQFPAERVGIDAVMDHLVIPSTGEPGPVVVSGAWRAAIAGTWRDAAFDELGIVANADASWVVVVADVTNWSDLDGIFPTGEVTLAHLDGADPVRLAPKSTGRAARLLGVEPRNPKAGVPIAAGATTRVVLVFKLPDGFPGPALLIGTERLPLNGSIVGTGGDLAGLPPLSAPLPLTPVSVVRVLDGSHVEVIDESGGSRTVSLFGTTSPVGEECFAGDAATRLAELAGERVWIEPQRLRDESEGVYLWRDPGDGTRRLVNQELIAGGYAAEGGIRDGRFTAWLESTDSAARATAVGRWAACPPQRATRPRPES